ncbi:nuclear transport factor 2 family protein [Lutimonas zeaxanthinifaciens]|uniref:nuclear transport factor 2 family protein n=1 Tax=Lutimonas zeaxanthinifaciens TaxID=3060215 RepID=UPI00265CCE85|nr:nuclear transport factor 2 family protein [Lutimonas sp. YSD2104]WKK64615.1 nuclear transport factor 2 family protein [Lutimonas sp. YSD2104]
MKYSKIPTLLLLILFTISNLKAQSNSGTEADKKEVLDVIVKLFDGMREGDSTKVASVFDKEVNMLTSYTNKEGEKIISKGDLSKFLTAIGTPHEKVWDEKIWNTQIMIDGGIAQVWTDYAFYVGTEFSHCGVDAFHLVNRGGKGWKIVHLMDTRKKAGCQE